MTTQQLQVSILAAPVAAMDRRALSQAWYSALGLTPRRPCIASDERRRSSTSDAAQRLRLFPMPARTRDVPSFGRSLTGGRAKGSLAPVVEDLPRRVHRVLLAERIERTFAETATAPKRATFSMGRGAARVHVILQTNRTGIVLLALCRPDMRAVVARALAQARAALAARGIGIELRMPGEFVCS